MTPDPRRAPPPPDILTSYRADVFVAGWDGADPSHYVVAALDAHNMRAIGDVDDAPPDDARIARLMQGCSALIVLDSGSGESGAFLERKVAEECGIPIAVVHRDGTGTAGSAARIALSLDAVVDGSERWEALLVEATSHRPPTPYAFFIGRLERDFRQARQAIRVAVEDETGMPCLWADDGRHRTGLTSVREQTRLLIEHSSLVIADLTLGIENPVHTNPSRAHEIGLATAYGRPLVLSSQEPRRVPYFSIGDLQMIFWEDEAELTMLMRRRLRAERQLLGRTIYNYRLPDRLTRVIRRPSFTYDPVHRYVGPGLAETES